MTTLAFTAGSVDPAPVLHPGIAVIPLGDALWRVTRPEGDVLGYVESFPTREGTRFRAKRLVARTTRFIGMGEFWSMNDAVDVFAA